MLSLSKMFGYVDKPQIELQRISGEGGIRPRRHEGLAAVLVLALVVQVFAGFALRGLYADGAYFVTQIISHQSFMHVAPCLSSGFVPAIVVPDVRSEVAPLSGRIEIVLVNGRRVIIEAGVDIAALSQLIAVLERR